MVIVAGHRIVDPPQRESYIADCVGVVEQARRAPGCLHSRSPPTSWSPAASTSLKALRYVGAGHTRGKVVVTV